MEWVETTAKTTDEAREAALDQLGVALDEAEIEVIEEPRAGLFGRSRGTARVRARVRPTPVRPKQDRRRRARGGSSGSSTSSGEGSDGAGTVAVTEERAEESGTDGDAAASQPTSDRSAQRGRSSKQKQKNQEKQMSNEERQSEVSPQEVGDAAVAFMDGLAAAFGNEVETTLTVEGTELDVAVSGEGLGLMVGSGGRTLNAIQDLARVAAQRRLGDHETRLRIDVASYRERRQAALADFARDVAEQVRASGSARSLEPMLSADRKVIHDVLNEEPGVASRSEGEDPDRRIVVIPAE